MSVEVGGEKTVRANHEERVLKACFGIAPPKDLEEQLPGQSKRATHLLNVVLATTHNIKIVDLHACEAKTKLCENKTKK